MMIVPRKNSFDLFDDMFKDPFFTQKDSQIMKTDIVENETNYLISLDLPGYDKKDIKISIEDGYLTVHATMDVEKNNDQKGKYVKRERFFGECSRSFYVGDIKEEDIKASFRNGTLSLEIPKEEIKEDIPEKKYITIDD